MSHPQHFQGGDWKKYQQFSRHVERQIKGAANPCHARSRLWVAKLIREYLGGES